MKVEALLDLFHNLPKIPYFAKNVAKNVVCGTIAELLETNYKLWNKFNRKRDNDRNITFPYQISNAKFGPLFPRVLREHSIFLSPVQKDEQ